MIKDLNYQQTISTQQKLELDALSHRLQDASDTLIGFPVSTDFDYSEIQSFFGRFLNNVGDPYVDPLHALHTKKLEREVVAFFAELFRAEDDNSWGYVTTGGTEGNLYGLYSGREACPGAVVYYSSSAHYSVPKNIHILGLQGIKMTAQPNGEMDYSALRAHLAANKAKTAIIFATIGTTMTEAKDNLNIIREILQETAVERYYIHCDAALAGVPLACLEPRHPFDFADGADSIAISGHKFIGSPMPSGVVLVKKEHKNRLARDVAYTRSPDTTISGSRSGHAPLMLWYAIKKWGIEGFRIRTLRSLELAEYTLTKLQEAGWQSWRNPDSFTVVIKQPAEKIIRKWQLATSDGWSHIICMPGVSRERIDTFIGELQNTQSLPLIQDPELQIRARAAAQIKFQSR